MPFGKENLFSLALSAALGWKQGAGSERLQDEDVTSHALPCAGSGQIRGNFDAQRKLTCQSQCADACPESGNC